MAYNVTTDYKALQDALKKQKELETDYTKQAALQSQIDAAQSSKEEKIASDLTAYGKYANDSELNNAAGIMAQNQLGTGYDIQRANLNKSYDNAKINANNDALSRGMARSSFVSDRLAGLDSDRATALSGVDTSQAMALQNARTNILNDYRTNTANALSNEKKEYADTQMTHYQDYQAEINRVRNDNDPTNNWQADKLQGWRNEKLLAQEAAALKAAKTAGGGSYRGGGDGDVESGTTSTAEATSNVNNWLSGGQSLAAISTMLNKQYTSGGISPEEYAAYKSVLDARRTR